MKGREKLAVVTGGSKGIGKGIALRLAGDGWDVLIADLDEKAGASALREFEPFGGTYSFVRTDVSQKAQVETLVQKACDVRGTIDLLVNNAGVVIDSPFLEISEEVWDKTLNTNLKGYL